MPTDERHSIRQNAFEWPAKLKIETATDIKRGGASGAITPRMTEAIFHTAKDAYGSSVGDVPTQWVVFRVTDIKTPKLDVNSPDVKTVSQTVRRQMADDVIGHGVALVFG